MSRSAVRRLRRLPGELASALEPVIREAERSGVRVALVGGIVRDLLRGEKAGRDVDLLVEGDAGELARRAAPAGRVTVHRRFGTATVEGEGGFQMDLASARRETYPRPGALPEVERATLEDDLARRDFSVNAIAWEPAAARLHDPFGGAADLAEGRLRILHPRSFEDDPTRIFRAVRYANRLGLRIDSATKRVLRAALAAGALETISADRVRHELAKTFSEPGWPSALRLAEKWGVLAALEPGWTISPRVRRALVRAADLAERVPPSAPRRAWLAGLLVAASELPGAARRRLAGRLALSGDELRAFERDLEASEARTREEAIARAALARASAERRILERRLTAPVRLSIRGSDLVGEGVPAGPAVGRALGETRRALEEGLIAPGEELSLRPCGAARRCSEKGGAPLLGKARGAPVLRRRREVRRRDMGSAVGLSLLVAGLSSAAIAAEGSGPTPTATPTPTPARAPTAAPKSASSPQRTFCAEWIRQSREGYDRMTLFADRMLVWKRSRDGKEDVQRKQIAPDELTFYCDYFSRDEVWAIPSDLRTGLSGDFAVISAVTVTRADGLRKTIRFDDFSPLSAEASGIRAALEGLRAMLTSPLSPASRFAPDSLAVGQILKRFDGALFRIKSIEKEKGIVELEGVREPYREYRKMEDLRFQFSPPE